MATTLTEICRFLDEEKLKFRVEEEKNRVLLLFDSSAYVDSEGAKTIHLGIATLEAGRAIGIFTHELYSYKEGPHSTAVLGACLYTSYTTKFVQFEWDPSDGEIRATVEFPLEDAPLTSMQLHRALRTLLVVIEQAHPMIRKAIDTGQLELPKKEEAAPAQLGAILQLLAKVDPKALEELMRKAGVLPGDAGEAKPPREDGSPKEL